MLGDLRASLVANKQVLVNSYEAELNANIEMQSEYDQKQSDLDDVIIPQVVADIA